MEKTITKEWIGNFFSDKKLVFGEHKGHPAVFMEYTNPKNYIIPLAFKDRHGIDCLTISSTMFTEGDTLEPMFDLPITKEAEDIAHAYVSNAIRELVAWTK